LAVVMENLKTLFFNDVEYAGIMYWISFGCMKSAGLYYCWNIRRSIVVCVCVFFFFCRDPYLLCLFQMQISWNFCPSSVFIFIYFGYVSLLFARTIQCNKQEQTVSDCWEYFKLSVKALQTENIMEHVGCHSDDP
jgi:Ca2+/Na+ antiporter